MSDFRPFPTSQWLQTVFINCLLLLVYGVVVYFVVRRPVGDRIDAIAGLLLMGGVIAFVFNGIANFLYFLVRKMPPEALVGILLAVQCLAFFGSLYSILFFWGASLINYGILKAFFRRVAK